MAVTAVMAVMAVMAQLCDRLLCLVEILMVASTQKDPYCPHVYSRCGHFPYNLARCPDLIEPPQLLGLKPSYFPFLIPPIVSSLLFCVPQYFFTFIRTWYLCLIFHRSLSFISKTDSVPASALATNQKTEVVASPPNSVCRSSIFPLEMIRKIC